MTPTPRRKRQPREAKRFYGLTLINEEPPICGASLAFLDQQLSAQAKKHSERLVALVKAMPPRSTKAAIAQLKKLRAERKP